MAKRKRRGSAPDLPEATLARARAQARGETYEPEEPEQLEQVESPTEAATPKPEQPGRSERRARRRAAPQPIQFGQPRRRNAGEQELDSAAIAQMLANPTRIVSEEQLHEEYGFVVRDIRSMFILAGFLIVLLVILAQFI